MPAYNYIPISQVRTIAKINLDLEDTTAYDRTLDFFISDGIKELRCLDTRKTKAIQLHLEDGKAELPCDFIYFFMLQMSNWNYVMVNTSYIEEAGVTLNAPYFDYKNVVHIENGIISIPNNEGATSATLIYKGGNADKDGNLLIPDIVENALAWYASYRFASKKRAKDGSINEFKRNWLVARSDVRGDMWMDTFVEDKQEIQSIINAWIVQKGTYSMFPNGKLINY